MNDIKWIFFDLGATLLDESDVYESRIEYALSHTGMERDEFMELVYETARTSPTAIKTAAADLGVILPAWDNSLEKLYPGVEEVLESLHGRFKLGIIANQTPGTQERIDNWGIGKYFDVVVASAEAGCEKPDLKIFNMALDEAGCKPEEAMMIGDRLDNDIVPAKHLGMKTVWVSGQGYAGKQELGGEDVDYIIERIAELPKALGI